MNPLSTLRDATGLAGELILAAREKLAEWIEPDTEIEHPDPIRTARVALAMATAASHTGGNPQPTFALISPMIEEMHPFHMIDVSLSLASMVAAIADEDDLARFGQSIMEAEVAR